MQTANQASSGHPLVPCANSFLTNPGPRFINPLVVDIFWGPLQIMSPWESSWVLGGTVQAQQCQGTHSNAAGMLSSQPPPVSPSLVVGSG